MTTDANDRLPWIGRAVQLMLDVWHEADPERRGRIERELADAPVALAAFRWPGEPLVIAPSWIAMFGDTIPPGIRALIDLALSTGKDARLGELAFHREPSMFPRAAEVVAYPGQRGSVVVAANDVTDEVLARQLGMPPRTVLWSRGGEYCSATWVAYTGRDVRERWQASVHPDELAACEAAEAGADLEARLRSVHGEYRWHRVRAIAVQGGVFSAVDIHDERAAAHEIARALHREQTARAEAERANRSKDRFLAVVSHELRAPVATLMMWERVLRDHADDQDLRARAIQAIRTSAATQSRLVADLLDISRAASGKLHLDRRRIPLGDVLAPLIQTIAPAAAAKQIELVSHWERRLGMVRGDPNRLAQVFDNLLSNAVKFTPTGGRITVDATRTSEHIIVSVTDTGIGISPDLLPRIFEPFAQSDDVMTRAHGGLGLGLAIAREIVMLHDGEIVASSPGPGLGTTFTVRLPPVVRRASSTPVTMAAVEPSRLDGLQILLVDDDEQLRAAIAALLSRAGATVSEAGSAAEARERLARESPEVVLCDIALPGEDGYTFVRSLRANPSTRDLPALAVTAYASEHDRQNATEAGFDRHVAKPIHFDDLVASIEQTLASRRS